MNYIHQLMNNDFAGKVAIITGGANGIGRATAEAFVAGGARVVIGDVDDRVGAQVAGALGAYAAFRATDVTDATQVQALVDFAVSRFGGLHVMCNNAGVSGSLRRFLDDDLRDFRRVMEVDVFGVMIGSRCAARHMVDHGRGHSSTSPRARASAQVSGCCRTVREAAVVHFTRSSRSSSANTASARTASHLRTSRLTSTPPSTRRRSRGLQPLPHQGHTVDVAEAVLYLAGDRAAHVTGVGAARRRRHLDRHLAVARPNGDADGEHDVVRTSTSGCMRTR